MRLAAPVLNDRVSPVFDTAGRLLLLDVADGAAGERQVVEIAQAALLTRRAKQLVELGVNVLICGAISRPLAGLVSAAGIVLIPWVAGPVEEVLRAHLAGRLSEPRWRMPGCGGQCRHGERRRHTRGRPSEPAGSPPITGGHGMIIAVTALGAGLDAGIDVRLGRAAAFVLLDTTTEAVQTLENREASNAGQGAGIQAARLLADQGVQVVLTGHCGPNAYRALLAAGIRVYTGLAEGTVRDAIQRFQTGSLQEAAGADVTPHW
jgi:predicted Fe-Mo cluster-binding NifX family protein